MPLTAEQKARLQRYIRKDDRSLEPVYVGREGLFRLVAGNAQAIVDGDSAGRTVCIAGPPGVGKTAFLAALDQRSLSAGWGGPPMACIRIGARELHSPETILRGIGQQLPPAWRPERDAALNFARRFGVSTLRLGFFGISVSTDIAPSGESKPSGFPWGEIAAFLSHAPSAGVICLVVDEAHKLAPTPGAYGNDCLLSLHEGPPRIVSGAGEIARAPVFAVFAGHTHTPEVLEGSISGRFASKNVHYMGGLSQDESLSYALGILGHLEVRERGPDREAVAAWVVGECAGFPHHLRNAMASIAEGLLRADGLRLADLDGAFVAGALRERRESYYRVRTEGAIAAIAPQLGALLRDWSRRPVPVDNVRGTRELAALIEGLSAEERGDLDKFGISDGHDLMRELVRKGALTPDADGRGCRCPIDSLIGWIERKAHTGRAPFPNLAPAGCKTGRPIHHR